MLSMDIFDNDDSEESFFSFLVLLMQFGAVLLPQPLLWKWFGWGRPCGRGELADRHMPLVVQLSFPMADARQPSSTVPAPASHLHCFPTCSQGSSSCLILSCLSARSSAWSWGCDLVRLPSRERWRERPLLTDPGLGNETARPKCWAVVSRKCQTCAKMLLSMASQFLNQIPQPRNPGGWRG